MNVEQLKKQAKELVRAAREGDAAALARFGDLPIKLASAQLVLARDHGYSSWPALGHAAEASVESFIHAATEVRRERAERLLAARPEIENDPWAALVLGRNWNGDPNAPGGPRTWGPLHYTCHTVFETTPVALDRLARGADPTAYFANDFGPMSTLYGAAGVKHDAELTRALLEAGADPNGEPRFGDALYHSVEDQDPACTKILLEYGARPNGSNALAHALDYPHPKHVRLLLEAGARPNGEIVHAVRRGRGPEFIRLLAEYGDDLDAAGGESWRGPARTRTAYQHAVLRGNDEAAEALRELGVSTFVADDDHAVAAVARGEPADLPAELDYDQQEVLILAALQGEHFENIVGHLGNDFAGVVGGSPSGTLLHHACWVGDADLVERLLARGADPVAPSGAEFDTPIAWAFLGSQGWRFPGRNYVRVAELLLAAGAELEPWFEEVAMGQLAEWLEGRI